MDKNGQEWTRQMDKYIKKVFLKINKRYDIKKQ